MQDGSDVPPSRSGDGLRAALRMSMYARLEGCTISMEEPENHTHPALISYFVDELLMGCRDSGNQVFLSTQSDDLIKYALEAGSLEQVSLLQLIKEGGETGTQPYDRDEAYEHRIKLGQDIRDVHANDRKYFP